MGWEEYMQEALSLAQKALDTDDVPVGALIVRDCDGAILGRGWNCRERDRDPLGHAEIAAIQEACKALNSWRLTGCTLYVTLEPCPMCTGALLQSRIDRIIFGAFDPAAGCCGSAISLPDELTGHRPVIYGGVLEGECQQILQSFFEARR